MKEKNDYTRDEMTIVIINTAKALKTLVSGMDSLNAALKEIVLALELMNQAIDELRNDPR